MLRKYSRYKIRQSLFYYALALPALVSELAFSIAIVSNPEQLLPQIAGSAVALQTVQALPWLLLLVSIYAVMRYRPSVLITLLTVSFFVSATVTSQMSFLGYGLSLGAAVALVIFSSFTSLVGFNFSRAAMVVGGRELRVRSSGPLGYQLLSLCLELATPLAAALGLVLLVSAIFSALRLQVSQLPEPLSSLSVLYLQTRFGTVFTTIAVAGAIIWVMRQFLEPMMLYFTLSHEDGVRLAASEVEDVAKKVRKEVRAKPPGGLRWSGLAAVLSGGILLYSLIVFGPQPVYSGLLSVFGLGQVGSTPRDYQVASSAKAFVIRVDVLYSQAENLIRTLIRLIWG